MYNRNINLDDDWKSLWLKQEMSERKITATDLARGLGVTPTTVTRWIQRDWADSKRIKGITQINFIAVCSYFGMEYGDAMKKWKEVGP